jgi:predicted O-linked N-acetylglucosamine transferase (SPINDLY family)
VLRSLLKWIAPSRQAAWHIARGRRAERRGRVEDACRHYRAAIAADPGNAAAHLDLGIALEATGDVSAALASFEAALARDPGNAFANYNLGRALFVRGDPKRAEALVQTALASKPDFAEAHVVLASMLEARENLPAAVAALEQAIALRPDYAGALRNLGALYCRMQQWNLAVTVLTRAAAAGPADADVRCWLGNALAGLGKREQAADSYLRVLQLQPGHGEAHWRLGNLLPELGRHAEAEAHVREALALDPQLTDAHVALGKRLAADHRYEAAADCYRVVLAVDPGNVAASANLGLALALVGDAEGARKSFDAALALDPEQVGPRWGRTMSILPAIRDADSDLGAIRAEFGAALADLDRWFDARPDAAGHLAVGTLQPFWLTYQEADNRELLQRYGQLCARLMTHWQAQQALSQAPRSAAQPIRVGVVSQYFRDHSVWHAIVKGWFQQIDGARFALQAFCLDRQVDVETRFAQARAARFEQGHAGLREWAAAILGAQPDVLIYPAIGLDPMSIRLASMRLAPVQATCWGHPDTSGLPTIDAYLSAADFEPPGAQAHYSERLIALPHLGSFVQPGAAEAQQPDLANLGIESGVPLLICPGTPFKYAPEHDGVLAEIARRLGRCRLVFFEYSVRAMSARLRARLSAEFARRGLDFDRCAIFVPWQSSAAFLGLLRSADVFLDTIGFSGFNTALRAVECSLPIVTREGRFLRGRLASGILKRVGLPELVAADEDQYVAIAVRLAQDRDYREDIRRRMDVGRPRLYDDPAPIRALEDFLAQGV